MTKEELLKPRYKVMMDYPESKFTKGQILTKGNDEPRFGNEHNNIDEAEMQKYPNVFHKLRWSEEINKADLPPYVKVITKSLDTYGKILKVKQWNFGGSKNKVTKVFQDIWADMYNATHLLPATEEEYKSHQSHTEK